MAVRGPVDDPCCFWLRVTAAKLSDGAVDAVHYNEHADSDRESSCHTDPHCIIWWECYVCMRWEAGGGWQKFLGFGFLPIFFLDSDQINTHLHSTSQEKSASNNNNKVNYKVRSK